MPSVTHQPERSTRVAAALAIVAAVLLTLGLINPAAAAPPQNPNQSAASWLASQVNADGALEGFTPGEADYGTTLQGIIGLAAAGAEGPTAQRMLDAVNGDIEAVVAPFGGDDPGRLALAILANVALGSDPTDVGGTDLVTRLQATQRTSSPDIGLYGSSSPTFDGAFRQGLALLALGSVDIDDPAGEAWLTEQQCATGSWLPYRADTAEPCAEVDAAAFSGPDTNSTALALIGLSAQGVTPTHDGVAWLMDVRTEAGGWPYFGDPTEPADASSTGLVLAALRTATGDSDAEGLTALRTFQIPCEAEDPADVGGLFFQVQTDGSELPDNFSTTQGLWGLGDVVFPVIDATLAEPVAPDCSAPTTTTTTTTAPSSTTTAPSSTTAAPSTAPATTAGPSTAPPSTTGAPLPTDVTAGATTSAPPSGSDAPSSPDDAPSNAAVPVAGPAGPPPTLAVAARPSTTPIVNAAPAPAQPVQAIAAAPTPAPTLATTGTSPSLLLFAAAAMLGIGAATLIIRRRMGMR